MSAFDVAAYVGPPELPRPGQDHHAREDALDASGLRNLGERAPVPMIEAALRRLVELLKEADPLRRAAVREEAVPLLRAAGVSSPARMLDSVLGGNGTEKEVPAGQGRMLTLEDPEPSRDAVNGPELLEEIRGLISAYVVMPPSAAVVVSLWVLLTFTFDAFSVLPILLLCSPTKRCGKTLLLSIIKWLARRSLAASNVTGPVIFRVVEAQAPTLLMDEYDTMKEDEALRGIVNSGHTRDTASVLRLVGDDHEPRSFSTWCPKVLAGIGRAPGTLEDRAIKVVLSRKSPSETTKRYRRRDFARIAGPIRSKLARWTADHLNELDDAEPSVPDALDDRAADNAYPLLALADAVGGEWPGLARKALLALCADRAEEESQDDVKVLLLRDLLEYLDEEGVPDGAPIGGDVLCEALRKLPERPWAKWGKSRDGLLPVHLAKLLSDFVKPAKVRIGRETPRRYSAAALRQAATRYISRGASPDPPHPEQVPNPPHETPKDSTDRDGVAGVAGVAGCGGSEADPSVYHHLGNDYRPGDLLPDGRLLESIEHGIPVLVRPRRPPDDGGLRVSEVLE